MSLPVLFALVATAAAAGPVVHPESRVVSAGDRYALVGSGWSVSPLCEQKVWISQTFGHGVLAGKARLADDGEFAFSRVIPRRTKPGTRLVFDATQYCSPEPGADAVGTTRSTTVRVARPPHACPYALSVNERAYVVTVAGSLRCSRGAEVIRAFLADGTEPPGFMCSNADPSSGSDAGCLQTNDPARRVTARRVREV